MNEMLSAIAGFLTDIERLKLVERTAYVSDLSRHENSAEHSWHLALGLLTIARELDLEINLSKALRMALIHDLCEIDAGDISIYHPTRDSNFDIEKRCVNRLAASGLKVGQEIRDLWLEYEAQETHESRWVRVLDRLMPFIVNLSVDGQTWRDQSISRSQVLMINEPVRKNAPEIFVWMTVQIEECVAKGWLRDA